jgi:hypothetical protein
MSFHVAWQGMVLGATLMYLLDPSLGGIRRERLRFTAVWTARWIGRRFLGRYEALRGLRSRRPEAPSEGDLLERVRSGLGCVSHPDAIEMKLESGHLTLSGPILAREVVALLRQVGKVHGVVRVHNRLRGRRASEDVPEWQAESSIGRASRRGARPPIPRAADGGGILPH